MKRKPLTQAEYLEDPNRCPVCGSEHLFGGEVTIDNGKTYQTVRCIDCDAEWTDHYKLVRYELS